MKNKILYLIIGILIGAIVTTSAFLIYNKLLTKNLKDNEIIQMNENRNMGEPRNRQNKDGGTPPKMPTSLDKNNI